MTSGVSSIGSAGALLDTSKLSAIHTGWWDELGVLRCVQRAKLSVRERGCVFDFLASRGGDLSFSILNQTRLRIPPDPFTKLSSPHNERAQKVLLTKVSDQKLPKNFHFLRNFLLP